MHFVTPAGARLRAWRGVKDCRERLWPLAIATLLVGLVWLQPPAAPTGCKAVRGAPGGGGAGGATAAAAAAWPTTGDSVHLIYTSNGSPYMNYQTLLLYGSWRAARRLPGGDKMVALTRVLHRSAHDALSPVIPTWRADPLHPECDGAAPRANQPCKYVVADRPNAVRQFIEAARNDSSLIKGGWLLLIETDYLFLRPVAAPGRAEDPGVRGLGYLFTYIAPRLPHLEGIMRRLYPPGMGPLLDIPRTGPAPIMARPADWLRVLPRWEGLTAQIESDAEIVKALGWMREMYAFSVAAAVERLDLELAEAPNSTLICQPPVDKAVGAAAAIHYTWGPRLLLASNGTEVWRFEKRDWVGPTVEESPPKQPLPPPFEEGLYKTPSALVGPKGVPTTREQYETILLEVQTARAAVDEVGGADWRRVLGAEAAASGAAAITLARP